MPYDSPPPPQGPLCFDRFVARPAERLLECDGRPVPIGSRAFDILMALLERPGEVVPHRDLMDRAWPCVTVEDANLRVHIANLRKALSPTGRSRRYIANVPGRGYAFTVPVKIGEPASPAATPIDAWLGAPAGDGGPSRLLGRDDDLKRLMELLAAHPLVTIVGMGGVGKTALARKLQASQADQFGAVHYLDLARTPTVADVPALLDRALGWTDSTSQARSGAGDALRPPLLIIDTCDKAVDEVATWSKRALAAAPASRILLASREATRSPHEQVFVLSPLPIGAAAADQSTRTAGSPALELFMQGARAGGYAGAFTDSDRAQALSICRLLDGNPLAIEIISSRVAGHGVQGIASLMDSPEWVLSQTLRGIEARHRTLAALIGWSYDLLSPDDQVVLQRLSTLQGSFTIATAEDMAADADISLCSVQGALSRLLDRSLLTTSVVDDVTHYRFANLVRMFGRAPATTTGATNAGNMRRAQVAAHAAARGMGTAGCAVAQSQRSASSSCLAALRSTVSNPSVNRP